MSASLGAEAQDGMGEAEQSGGKRSSGSPGRAPSRRRTDMRERHLGGKMASVEPRSWITPSGVSVITADERIAEELA